MSEASSNLKKKRPSILMVDGEARQKEGSCKSIEEQGYEVVVVNDATKAMNAIDLRPKGWAPVFMIVDLHLTKVSAYEIVRKLADRFSGSVPIVMTANDPCAEEQGEAYGAGASAMVKKPLEIDTITKIIEERKLHKLRNQSQLENFKINYE